MTIVELFHPVSPALFCSEYLGVRHLVCTGSPTRYSSFFSWQDINVRLTHLHVARGRVQVIRNGSAVDERLYVSSSDSTSGPTIVAPRLEALLRDGGTVMIRHGEEIFDGLRPAHIGLCQLLRASVDAVVFVTLGGEKGFARHWDPYDTFVCQVSGRKRWTVYEPVVPHPFGNGSAVELTRVKEPVWDGILGPGDLLYMPRGWPHAPVPVGGPSLHVTFAATQPTGISLLRWLTREMEGFAEARRDLPLFAKSEDQDAFVLTLREKLDSVLTSGIIQRYYQWQDANRLTLRELRLEANSAEDGRNGEVSQSDVGVIVRDYQRLYTRRYGADRLAIVLDGTELYCAKSLEPALNVLSDVTPHTLNELAAMIPSEAQSELGRTLSVLINQGFLRYVRR